MNKVEGAKETCFCGSPVVCVKISYQGKDSLQWQNLDGKAHYNPRNADGTYPPCNSTVEKKEQNLTTAVSNSPQSSTAAPTSQIVNPPNTENIILADFEKIYRSGIPTAERIAKEAILFGQPQTLHDISVVVQCIMKAYIQYYIAMDAAARRR